MKPIERLNQCCAEQSQSVGGMVSSAPVQQTKLQRLEEATEHAAQEFIRVQTLTKEEQFRLGCIAQTKTLRKALDEQLQVLKSSTRQSRERSLSITKIQEAIMWLGMDLKDLGAGADPYPSSYDPASPVVEKTADGLTL